MSQRENRPTAAFALSPVAEVPVTVSGLIGMMIGSFGGQGRIHEYDGMMGGME